MLRHNILGLVLVAGVLSPVRGAEPEPPPSVAVFRLGGAIVEDSGAPDPLALLSGGTPTSLRDLVARIERATGDKALQGLALLLEGPTLGPAQREELVAALDRFKTSGKPVYVLAEVLGTGDYVLASRADHVSLVPGGEVGLTGLYAESPYIRGLLDLLGVQPDFLTCGDFKSAGETFMRSGPSPNAAAMQTWLLDSQFETYVELIAEGRGVDADKVRKWIDEGPYTASRAKKKGLIDAIEHRREFYARLRKKHGEKLRLLTGYGQPTRQQIDLSSPLGLLQLYSQLMQGPRKVVNTKDTVAVVYLQGTIVSGSLPVSPLGGAAAASATLSKTLGAVERDKTVKAVVLRVNSPGGSALASEVILDAVTRVRARKPLVVSMGDVAASGGYYVACRADSIYADRTTITGSIGVVSGKFATTGLWNRLGIQWSTRQRGKHAALLGSARVFSEDEHEKLQDMMDEIYDVFKQHVVEGRGKKLVKSIDKIAGGRVYTGRQALELGLVDRLGGLSDAIGHAAQRAGIKDYDIRVVPRPRALLESLMGEGGLLRLGVPTAGHERVDLLARVVPLLSTLEPRRAAAIRRVVGHLERLQHERVLLLGPEILIHD